MFLKPFGNIVFSCFCLRGIVYCVESGPRLPSEKSAAAKASPAEAEAAPAMLAAAAASLTTAQTLLVVEEVWRWARQPAKSELLPLLWLPPLLLLGKTLRLLGLAAAAPDFAAAGPDFAAASPQGPGASARA